VRTDIGDGKVGHRPEVQAGLLVEDGRAARRVARGHVEPGEDHRRADGVGEPRAFGQRIVAPLGADVGVLDEEGRPVGRERRLGEGRPPFDDLAVVPRSATVGDRPDRRA
jgi:hypothetical protein